MALRVFILFSDVFELTTELAAVLATEFVVKVALGLSLDGTLVAILLVAVMTVPVLTSKAWLAAGAGDELRFVTGAAAAVTAWTSSAFLLTWLLLAFLALALAGTCRVGVCCRADGGRPPTAPPPATLGVGVC